MLATERDPRIAAFVSLEGAGRKIPVILEEQMRAGGASQQVMDEVVAVDNSLLAGKTVASPDPQLAALFRPSVQPYPISDYRYEPADEFAKLKVPVAIVQGTTDLQVSLTDAKRLSDANKRAKLIVIDGMNHVLRDAPHARDETIATYTEPSLPLDAKLVPAIAAFLSGTP